MQSWFGQQFWPSRGPDACPAAIGGAAAAGSQRYARPAAGQWGRGVRLLTHSWWAPCHDEHAATASCAPGRLHARMVGRHRHLCAGPCSSGLEAAAVLKHHDGTRAQAAAAAALVCRAAAAVGMVRYSSEATHNATWAADHQPHLPLIGCQLRC